MKPCRSKSVSRKIGTSARPSASASTSSASTLCPSLPMIATSWRVCTLRLPEHVGDAAFLDDHDAAVAMVRTMGLDLPLRHVEVGVAEGEAVGPAGAIVGDLGGAEADPVSGVRLDQLAARLVEDAPVAGELRMLLHE